MLFSYSSENRLKGNHDVMDFFGNKLEKIPLSLFTKKKDYQKNIEFDPDHYQKIDELMWGDVLSWITVF